MIRKLNPSERQSAALVLAWLLSAGTMRPAFTGCF